ncbi:MAG: DNA-3-methyladenine glycosylase 2 family protein, partial [Actinomycetota bacterium]|nr:DNA-3-methyladenine glycosylase 2 family protein [Actinomycetota bacterium]
LQPAELAALEPAEALRRLRTLPGIGPLYATLILLRSTGATDVMTGDEPGLSAYVGHFYDLGGPATAAQVARISQAWRPFRTWVSVLVRVAGDRHGLPLDRGPVRGGHRSP